MTKPIYLENISRSLESALRFANSSGAWITPGKEADDLPGAKSHGASIDVRQNIDNIRCNLSGDAKTSTKKPKDASIEEQNKVCIVFVVHGLSVDEDGREVALFGKSLRLLNEMVGALGLGSGSCVVASFPSNGGSPSIETGHGGEGVVEFFSWGRVSALAAKVVCPLGAEAARRVFELAGDLLCSNALDGFRGKARKVQGTAVVPTHHPAYLLENLPLKRETWEDLKIIKKIIGKL